MTFNMALILIAVAIVSAFGGYVFGFERGEFEAENKCRECGGAKGKHFLNCSVWNMS